MICILLKVENGERMNNFKCQTYYERAVKAIRKQLKEIDE